MVTEEEYEKYFGRPAPSNFSRLESISLSTIKSVITKPIPKETWPCFKEFQEALLEQIGFYEENPDLITSTSTTSSGHTLGSYSESASNKNEISKSIERLGPMTYDKLLNCGLLQSQLGGCCLW